MTLWILSQTSVGSVSRMAPIIVASCGCIVVAVGCCGDDCSSEQSSASSVGEPGGSWNSRAQSSLSAVELRERGTLPCPGRGGGGGSAMLEAQATGGRRRVRERFFCRSLGVISTAPNPTWSPGMQPSSGLAAAFGGSGPSRAADAPKRARNGPSFGRPRLGPAAIASRRIAASQRGHHSTMATIVHRPPSRVRPDRTHYHGPAGRLSIFGKKLTRARASHESCARCVGEQSIERSAWRCAR